MKKAKILRSLSLIVIIFSISAFMFTGCQKKTDNTTAQNNQNQNATRGQNRGNFDPAQMKTRMSDSIKSLVDDKTITQEQSDKIVEALTSNMGNFGNRGNGNNGQTYQKNNNKNGNTANNGSSSNKNSTGSDTTQGSNSNGDNKPSQGNNPNNPRNKAINDLVTQGVITQDQANKVLEKIQSGFGRPQGQGQQQNSDQQSSNSNQ